VKLNDVIEHQPKGALFYSLALSLLDISIDICIHLVGLIASASAKSAEEQLPHLLVTSTTTTFLNDMIISRFVFCVAISPLAGHVEKN